MKAMKWIWKNLWWLLPTVASVVVIIGLFTTVVKMEIKRHNEKYNTPVELKPSVKHAGEMAVLFHRGIVRSKELDVFLKKRCERERQRTLEIEECRRRRPCAVTMDGLVHKMDHSIGTTHRGSFELSWHSSGRFATITWMSPQQMDEKHRIPKRRVWKSQ